MAKTRVDIPEIKNFFQINRGVSDFFYYHYSPKDSSMTSELPIQINGFAAGICMKGWMDVSIDGIRTKIEPDEFFIVLPCYMIQVHETSEDLDFQFVLVSDTFMNKIQISAEKFINPYFFIEKKQIFLIDDDESKELILTMYDSIHKLCKFYSISHYKEMIQHYIYAFLFGVGYLYDKFVSKDNLERSNLILLKRFFSFLQMNFKKNRTVKFYAEELCSTPKYLSRYLKVITGRTASEWIHNIVILEAKVLLSRRDLTIQEISLELNFSDQTTFGKFFKKHTGFTPTDYRRQSI